MHIKNYAYGGELHFQCRINWMAILVSLWIGMFWYY